MMRAHGVDCTVVDPDFYHIASSPEWVDGDIDGDHGDDFYPDWRRVTVGGYTRPDWFLQGPSPLVFSELAARETGRRAAAYAFRQASRFYRLAIGSDAGKPSLARRLLERSDPVSVALKRVIRGATGVASRHATGPADVSLPQPAAGPIPDALPPRVTEATMRAALSGFDAIIGYALGGRYPAALGLTNFASLELGTLRGLPFENSTTGRLCADVYRRSPAVFVTNVDCLGAAGRLGLSADQVVAIPHPFDVEAAMRFAASPSGSPVTGDIPYFFAPARHHWRQGNASWLKGNDILIRGAAQAASEGLEFRLVFVEWGEDLDASRGLVDSLGLAKRVSWLKPMSRRRVWATICGSAGVIDQFAAPAFGGVGLETMALGRPLISRIGGTDLNAFFSAPPPIIDAADPGTVAAAITRVLRHPADAAELGRRGQDWMQTQHGTARQIDLQFGVLARLCRSQQTCS
jgi:glycosyltransferase involved in cell wall biosynthesis